MSFGVYFSTHSDYKPYDYSKHLLKPTHTLYAREFDFRQRHFTITDSDKSTPLYNVTRHPHTEYFDIFRHQSLSETSTDATAAIIDSSPAPVGTIDFDKKAQTINLFVNNKSLETLSLFPIEHRFRFKTSCWGVLRWEPVSPSSPKYKCVCESVLETLDKWVAVAEDRYIELCNYQMDDAFRDEVVVSWVAMVRQDNRHVLHE